MQNLSETRHASATPPCFVCNTYVEKLSRHRYELNRAGLCRGAILLQSNHSPIPCPPEQDGSRLVLRLRHLQQLCRARARWAEVHAGSNLCLLPRNAPHSQVEIPKFPSQQSCELHSSCFFSFRHAFELDDSSICLCGLSKAAFPPVCLSCLW